MDFARAPAGGQRCTVPAKFAPALLALLLALTACGGDDDADDAEDTTTTTSATTTTTSTVPALSADEIDVDASPYCAIWAELVSLPSPAAAVESQRDYNARLADVGERLLAAAPPEIADAVEVALDEARARAETGDTGEFSDELLDAQRRLGEYVYDNCRTDADGSA